MSTEIKLPELGENVEGGDVVDIKVAAGAEVREGQALLEVEADKATVEVPSPSAGRISKVLVKRGDAVKTGQTLFIVEALEAAGATPKAETKPSAGQPKASVAQAAVGQAAR